MGLSFPSVRKMGGGKWALDHIVSWLLFCDPLRCQIASEVPSNANREPGDRIAIRHRYTIFISWLCFF